jgi:hypothetical protein
MSLSEITWHKLANGLPAIRVYPAYILMFQMLQKLQLAVCSFR